MTEVELGGREGGFEAAVSASEFLGKGILKKIGKSHGRSDLAEDGRTNLILIRLVLSQNGTSKLTPEACIGGGWTVVPSS